MKLFSIVHFNTTSKTETLSKPSFVSAGRSSLSRLTSPAFLESAGLPCNFQSFSRHGSEPDDDRPRGNGSSLPDKHGGGE
ncbi:hypothetical protein CEXT_402231 [Caerostris extrusa]|uniref:Uncharacterized protein n=1 Tax=Caerostris extrusa TaxID=172846 RepID=A0AAV4WML5_CAEEX|nr:hypothetical protein CEXT_402231 [Caerostris extrusa]